MTDFRFEKQIGTRIVNIGTAGGQVKASTGYAFIRIQTRMKSMAKALAKGKSPIAKTSLSSHYHYWLDRIFLNVLLHQRLPSDTVFTDLFANNPPERILRFMDEKTNLLEDLRIMNSLPAVPFLKAFWDEVFFL